MDQRQYYILLKDTMGKGIWGKRNPHLFRGGAILYLTHEFKQPEDPGKIRLRWRDITVEWSKLDVSQLTYSEHDLLVAVDSEEERISLYRDKNRLTEAKALEAGCEVFVKLRKENTELQLPGVIRWKGRLYGYRYGIRFGVELLGKESEGCGDSDGTYHWRLRKERYFTCPANQGVFVTVDKLRLRQDQDQECMCQRSAGLAACLDEERKIREETERRLHRSEHRSHELELSLAAESQEHQQRLIELEASLAEERQAHDETRRRLRSNQQTIEEIQTRLRSNQQTLEETETRLRSNQQTLEETETRLRSNQQTLEETETRLRSNQQTLEETQTRLRSNQQTLEETETRLRSNQQTLEETQTRLRSNQQRLEECEASLVEETQAHRETDATLTTVRQAFEDYRRSIESTRDWVVSRQDIRLSDKVIGVGAWGEVKEGTFRGCKVAVKKIHPLILCDHNRRQFEREMNMASRCRHPCLLQFIGATNDQRSPLFVTELLDTSLRAVLQEDLPLEPREITTIALDVAKGLNYLHLSHPAPIIHRDISNANVLLWKHDTIWRAKVSDYGTANFLQQSMTACPGAIIYSAPEAQTSTQSPKLDVYSFGVLLCEMSVREMPDPDRREEQVAMVTNRSFRNLIRRCLQQNPEERPSMAEIIETLERSPQ